MLPDLKTLAGFEALREEGYRFGVFDRPQNFKMQAEIIDLAVRTAGSLTAEPSIVSDTAYLVLDSLLQPPRGFEFFQRFPKEEMVQFTNLAVASRNNGQPLPVVCPVCPDYPEKGVAVIGDGLGYAAERVLKNLEIFFDFFQNRSVQVNVHMLLADVEVLNPIMLGYSGETATGFLKKTSNTQRQIEAEIKMMGMSGSVSVGSMAAMLSDRGFDYLNRHQEAIAVVKSTQLRKVIRVRQLLLQERKKLLNFSGFSHDEMIDAVDAELADYVVFGDFVDGRALILSPDAASAVPAYNFLRTGHDQKMVNPTILLKNVKIADDRSNYD